MNGINDTTAEATEAERRPFPTWARRTVTGLSIATAFFIGIGAGGSGETSTSAEPEVKTEEVEVRVTPDSCIAALDASERLVHEVHVPVMSELFPDAVEAAAYGDYTTLDGITADMGEYTDLTEVIVSEYNVAATDCRASAS